MARIEEKRKEKLSSVVGTWVVFGILGAVVITGIVLLIIYLVGLGNNVNTEKTFEERFPVAEENEKLMTYQVLDDILHGDTGINEEYLGRIYVFVYSPDFETYEDVEINHETAKTLNEYIDLIVEKNLSKFFILNVEDEDNEGFSGTNVPTFSDYPVLLVIENGEIITEPIMDGDVQLAENGTITLPSEIIDVLDKLN